MIMQMGVNTKRAVRAAGKWGAGGVCGEHQWKDGRMEGWNNTRVSTSDPTKACNSTDRKSSWQPCISWRWWLSAVRPPPTIVYWTP